MRQRAAGRVGNSQQVNRGSRASSRCSGPRRSRRGHACGTTREGTWSEEQDEAALDEWQEALPPEAAEAVSSSLDKLEWRALLEQAGRFCATALGRERVYSGRLGSSRAESRHLLAQTAAALSLETQYCLALNFGGANTAVVRSLYRRFVVAQRLSLVSLPALSRQAREALRKARLGSALTGTELLAVVAVQSCASEMQRTVASAGCTPDAQGRTPAKGSAPEVAPLREVLQGLVIHTALAQRVRQAVAEDGVLKDSATPQLASARSARSTAEARVRRALLGAAAALGGASVVGHMDRLCLAVPPSLGGSLPDSCLLLGRTSDGASLLVEPSAAVALNTSLEAATVGEREADLAARWALTQAMAPLLPDLDAQLDAVAEMDAIAARARHSAALGGVEPSLVGPGGAVVLRGLRHPLLVERMDGPPWEQERDGAGGPSSVVPVDVVVPPGTRVVLVSGPNSGGKTAAAKALALAALASRAGLFVPATSASLPWFDRVLCDIGDEQSLGTGLSTFSGRLQRAALLLRCSTPRTLLLLDELGAGTAPADGAALGQAVLAEAAAVAALTVATSHSGALKALKYAPSGDAGATLTPQLTGGAVENAAAEFDTARLAPTFRLLWGVPGRSRALEVAARLGLPEAVLDRARASLDGATARMEDTVAALERARGEQLAHDRAADVATQQAAVYSADVAQALRTLDAARDSVTATRAAAVGRFAAAAQAAIDRRKTSKAAKPAEQPAEQPAAAPTLALRARPSVRRTSDARPKAQEAPAKWQPAVGDSVLVARLGSGTHAVVTAVLPGGQLTVRAGAGALQLQVAVDDVLPAKKAAPLSSGPAARARALGVGRKRVE